MSPRSLPEFAAARVRALEPSPTLQVSERVRSLRRDGVEVFDLAGGDPDFETPAHVRRAAAASMDAGETHYVAPAGLPELRRAIASKLARENRVQVDPESGVLVTPGGKAALFEAMQAFVEPGTEVLILDPSWVSFAPMVRLAGGTPVRVALSADDGFALRPELLRAATSARTRILLVNSPNNPTGRMLNARELAAIGELAIEHDLLVFSDEIYERIVFDGNPHVSPASLPELRDRTLTFNGFSKAYAMTGWRLGYVAGPAPLISAIGKVHGHSATCVPAFLQRGALAALEGPQEFLSGWVGAWDRRLRVGLEALAKVPSAICSAPEGAFYLFADLRRSGRGSVELANLLVERAHVAVMPGVAFGANGEGFLRIALTSPDPVFREAMERLAGVLATL